MRSIMVTSPDGKRAEYESVRIAFVVALERLGKDQKWLADQLHTDESLVSKWLRGKLIPSQSSLNRIVDILYSGQELASDELRLIRRIKLLEPRQKDSLKEPSAKYGTEIDIKSIVPLTPENTLRLPLLADIPAGLPDYSDKDVESFSDIPRYLFPGADFVIKCIGESMVPEIAKGAYCVIRKETEPIHNAIMIVKTEEGFTMKRVVKVKEKIELHPANGNHKVIHPKELKIIGEVIGTWNRIKPR
jgi:SOS-response transcriptional repressor LexA